MIHPENFKASESFFEPRSPEYPPRLKRLPVFLTLKKPDFGVPPAHKEAAKGPQWGPFILQSTPRA